MCVCVSCNGGRPVQCAPCEDECFYYTSQRVNTGVKYLMFRHRKKTAEFKNKTNQYFSLLVRLKAACFWILEVTLWNTACVLLFMTVFMEKQLRFHVSECNHVFLLWSVVKNSERTNWRGSEAQDNFQRERDDSTLSLVIITCIGMFFKYVFKWMISISTIFAAESGRSLWIMND